MVELLDTAGQEEYTALRDQWIRDGEGFVLLYGIGSRSSFTRIQRFHNQITRVKFPYSLGPFPPTPIMLVGHDYAEGSDPVDREVSEPEGFSLSRELGCDFMEASAKKDINVENVIFNLVRKIRGQRQADEIERRRQLKADEIQRRRQLHPILE